MVLYGSLKGLKSAKVQNWHQDSPGVTGHNERDDRFGGNVRAGDFNSNGFTDLEIDVLGENNGAGRRVVLYGTRTGLKPLCALELQMIWERDGDVIRREPYIFDTDACGGYRCALSHGDDISPACFNASQCRADCSGICVHIRAMQSACK